MEIALVKLRELLASAGLSPEEADTLLFQFLEEEAFDYVDCIRSLSDDDAVYEGNSGLMS